ncbi:LysR family transcriptional regulator [Thalassorhabdomicrobium marinisediminis]|uniref:LysR family transcriptional regulator n=1 Tax=Thalassorhabdomicrobium marinisediminis TaxID=2170577 RepID=A0A2T7FZ30_9RHOB|nr:LysR family transcriptional regulator [Thalassorhabdomicrobium marinisediminis]PVA07426.1 LysR family transcriptional regulator [Thalassorhabdomicrobium marinisediminis]
MELKWLEDFVMLAHTASFSRAADARGVTQSAFSRRIKQLEAWLNTTLVNRSSLPSELTAEGRTFLPMAQEMIRSVYGARQLLHPDASDADSFVRIAALHTLALTALPACLDQMRLIQRDIRSEVMPDQGGIEANLATLAEGETDFFLTYAHPFVPLLLDPELFSWHVMGRDRVLPVAAPELNLEGKGRCAGEGILDLAVASRMQVPYLDYGTASFFGTVLQRIFYDHPGLDRQIVHRSAICSGLRELALLGRGVCWLPEQLVRADLDRGTLVLAGASEWTFEVEVRLYRLRAEQRRTLEQLWTGILHAQ